MSNCTTCGAPLKPNAKFCEMCGAPALVAIPAVGKPASPAPAARQQPVAPQPATNASGARINAARAAANMDQDGHRNDAARCEVDAKALARSATAPADIISTITAIVPAPYVSSFSDEERATSERLPATAPKHARKMCEQDVAEVSQQVNNLAVSIREHVRKAARDDMDAVQNAGAVIDQMEHHGTYHSDIVSFNELESVKRYRANIEQRLDADRTVIKEVSAWLDQGVPGFLDDARTLAVRMWSTFEQSAIDRAQADYEAASTAYNQAKQNYQDTKDAYDEKVRRNSKQVIEPSYAPPMSASFRRYAKLFLGLVVLTLVLSLICWLFLHVAIIIMALPIVRLIGIVGAIGFFVASIVMERVTERKHDADIQAQNAAAIEWNAQLDAERQQALVQSKSAMDAAQKRKIAARKALEQAKQGVDLDERVAFTSLTNTFMQALGALNCAVEPAISTIGKQWPIDGFEQAIDDEWMDQLLRYDPAKHMAVDSKRQRDIQTKSQLEIERDTKQTNEALIKEQARQTREQQKQTKIARQNFEAAEASRRELEWQAQRQANAAIQAAQAQQAAALAQEEEAWAATQEHNAAANAHKAAENYHNAATKRLNNSRY